MRARDFATGVSFVLLACVGQTSINPGTPRRSDPSVRPVSECSSLDLSAIGPLDVAIAIDASRSTVDPTGADINQNGRVGTPQMGTVGLVFDVGSTDPGDSYLAAQVAAARSLIRAAAGPQARFSIISYCGFSPGARQMSSPRRNSPRCDSPATAFSSLTIDINELEAALDGVLKVGGSGSTDFTAGMNAAIEVLSATYTTTPPSRRLVLFLSDSPLPVVFGDGKELRRYDPGMKDAASRAIEVGIVFNTFGLGEAAASVPPFALSQIASATGGVYRSVSDPLTLHCDLARSLLP
jgi:hypothetical protein